MHKFKQESRNGRDNILRKKKQIRETRDPNDEVYLSPVKAKKPRYTDGSKGRITPEHEYFFSVTNQAFLDPKVLSKARTTTVKAKRWNANEDTLLMNLVGKYAGNWKKISERLETARGHNDQTKTPIDCSKRWRNLKKQKQADWSEKENDKLLNLVSTKGCNWSVFTKYFNNRTKDQLRKHYLKLKKNGRVPQIKKKNIRRFAEYQRKVQPSEKSENLKEIMEVDECKEMYPQHEVFEPFVGYNYMTLTGNHFRKRSANHPSLKSKKSSIRSSYYSFKRNSKKRGTVSSHGEWSDIVNSKRGSINSKLSFSKGSFRNIQQSFYSTHDQRMDNNPIFDKEQVGDQNKLS